MSVQPAAPPNLWVVRHGATEWSISGRHTGRTDVPLVEEGRTQASGLRQRLSPHRFDLVLTSPLSRARETADLAGFGATAEVCDDLAEWDYGAYEGLTTPEIQRQRPGWWLWGDGVVGGETFEQLARRADTVIERARAASGDVLAFAHGHILRIVCARWVVLPARDGSRFVFDAAALGILGWEHEEPAIRLWNETGPEEG